VDKTNLLSRIALRLEVFTFKEVANVEDNIAVHCKTKEEWNRVQDKAMQEGHEWYEGEKYIEYPTKYGAESCLSLADKCLRYADRDCYGDWDGYKIISAQEYLNEGGKDVSEFKVGDRVECINVSPRDGVNPNNYITLGNIYTIEKINGLRLKLKDIGDTGTTYTPDKDRFKLASTKTQTTKENNMNKNISDVFDKTKEALLVEKHLGAQIGQGFIAQLTVQLFNKEILAEAKRLEKEEKEGK
jgi:hypothetical protein